MREALAIGEKVLGPEHLHTAECLNTLAHVLRETGYTSEAEPLLPIAIGEKALGRDHPHA